MTDNKHTYLYSGIINLKHCFKFLVPKYLQTHLSICLSGSGRSKNKHLTCISCSYRRNPRNCILLNRPVFLSIFLSCLSTLLLSSLISSPCFPLLIRPILVPSFRPPLCFFFLHLLRHAWFRSFSRSSGHSGLWLTNYPAVSRENTET